MQRGGEVNVVLKWQIFTQKNERYAWLQNAMDKDDVKYASQIYYLTLNRPICFTLFYIRFTYVLYCFTSGRNGTDKKGREMVTREMNGGNHGKGGNQQEWRACEGTEEMGVVWRLLECVNVNVKVTVYSACRKTWHALHASEWQERFKRCLKVSGG